MSIVANILSFPWLLGANGYAYMYSEPRYSLTQKSNCVVSGIVGTPRTDDAGNWSGCAPGVGQLIGTCRDWSACAESDYLGRTVTPQELYNLSFDDVAQRMTAQFNKLGLNQLSNQDVANITMHVAMHFGPGNLRVVQRALNDAGENVTVDGQFGSASLEALKRQTKKNPNRIYNLIRNRLEESYSQANPVYRKGFLSNMEHFPAKNESGSMAIWILIAVVVLILILYIIFFL